MAITLTPIKMTDGSQRLKLVSPYHPEIAPAAKRLGGKWDAERKAWYFDPRDADAVRVLAQRIYGVDPLAPADVDLVTVRVGGPWSGDSAFLFGRQVARRAGRDASVQLGEGVVIIEGRFAGSGGSARHPDLNGDADVVLEIRDVPRSLVEAQREHLSARHLEILEDAPPAVAPPVASEQIVALARLLTPGQRAAVAERILALN